jgi:hypothetical protein
MTLFNKIKLKRRKEADENVRRAERAIRIAENKAKNTLHDQGVQARKDEKARLLFIQQHQVLGAYIPEDKWVPVRDPEKQPTPAETEALRANQSLYDNLEFAQKAKERAYAENPQDFTSIPIDPKVLEMERQYKKRQRGPLGEVIIPVDSEEEGSRSGSDENPDIISSPLRSVASIDSIAHNADFIQL